MSNDRTFVVRVCVLRCVVAAACVRLSIDLFIERGGGFIDTFKVRHRNSLVSPVLARGDSSVMEDTRGAAVLDQAQQAPSAPAARNWRGQLFCPCATKEGEEDCDICCYATCCPCTALGETYLRGA